MLRHVASWGDRHPQANDFAKAEFLVNWEPAESRFANFAARSLQFDQVPQATLLRGAIRATRHSLKSPLPISAALATFRMRSPVATYCLMVLIPLACGSFAINSTLIFLRLPVAFDLNILTPRPLLVARLVRLLRRAIWLHWGGLSLLICLGQSGLCRGCRSQGKGQRYCRCCC